MLGLGHLLLMAPHTFVAPSGCVFPLVQKAFFINSKCLFAVLVDRQVAGMFFGVQMHKLFFAMFLQKSFEMSRLENYSARLHPLSNYFLDGGSQNLK